MHRDRNADRNGSKVKLMFPKSTLEEAIKIPLSIKDKNGGNPWPPSELANAIGVSSKTNSFYYLTAASRDYGLTFGTKVTKEISLAELGKKLVYAPDSMAENEAKKQAFLSIKLFKDVLNYYKGGILPEIKFLSNTLESKFGIPPKDHALFAEIFKKNCTYVGIKEGVSSELASAESGKIDSQKNTIIVGESSQKTGLNCFVIMPFREKEDHHPNGFFTEALSSLIVPAASQSGFTVTTANRKGSDVIQSTIINDLLNADLVLADLTEHNPNVLFELGMRMAEDKPVVLIRAKGTSQIFDVDNMLRVFDYDSNLWPSTIEQDMPKLAEFIKASWDNRDSEQTYLKILKGSKS
jgi:hypothetical protein